VPLNTPHSTGSDRKTNHSPPLPFLWVGASRLEQHLAKAEEHVERGAKIIERQRTIVAELERDGHNTAEALKLLAEFDRVQATYIEHRDRLKDELAKT
jgi:hypothetical protein